MPLTEKKPSRIMAILEKETGGKSYKSFKYSLDDSDRSAIEYGEPERVLQWARRGETKLHTTEVDLTSLSKELARSGDSILTYFLDGSRHVYKVDDMGFEKGLNRTAIYPIIAGQIGVGCCCRRDRNMSVEDMSREIVIAMPDIAQSSRKKTGFMAALAQKLNAGTELSRIRTSGWEFSTILSYKSAKEEKDYGDKGTAQIQVRMMEREQEMVRRLVEAKKLNAKNYLLKDGSLEYRPSKLLRTDPRAYQRFKSNYDYVLGVSKRFNPEVCFVSSDKANPGFIAELPLYSRTPVAYFKDPEFLGDIAFAVWYIRIRPRARTRTPFEGIIKVEKILVQNDEILNGMESDLVDYLSAYLMSAE